MEAITKTCQAAFLMVVLGLTSCHAQSAKIVGGPCEGCEAIYEYGDKKLSATDTLPGFENNEPKLKISGTVYRQDGQTPASDVIIYIYHTNRRGVYETKGDETGWAKRHGFIRGWVKTGKDGKYTFYTFRPGGYPGGEAPEHIHITVKEPDKNEYYLDDFLFADDPKLTLDERDNQRKRGGSGIMQPLENNGMLTIKRDILLGENIPNYE
jgi:protocatechuate 3,4-dioxygenase, beta subunit